MPEELQKQFSTKRSNKNLLFIPQSLPELENAYIAFLKTLTSSWFQYKIFFSYVFCFLLNLDIDMG